MYIPASFREDRPEEVYGLIRANPLGTLVSHDAAGLQASPLPFLLDASTGEHGVLQTHMARANPHWKALAEDTDCLVIFQGSDGYVSPNWYPSKAATHKAVPTWNYAVVHVWGRPRVMEGGDWLDRQLQALTANHEAIRSRPWGVADAPADFIAAQKQAIIGVEITITRIEGKWKMSQNREEADRQGVIVGLRDPQDPHSSPVLADEVARRLHR